MFLSITFEKQHLNVLIIYGLTKILRGIRAVWDVLVYYLYIL